MMYDPFVPHLWSVLRLAVYLLIELSGIAVLVRTSTSTLLHHRRPAELFVSFILSLIFHRLLLHSDQRTNLRMLDSVQPTDQMTQTDFIIYVVCAGTLVPDRHVYRFLR
jgi:hypothetical protein